MGLILPVSNPEIPLLIRKINNEKWQKFFLRIRFFDGNGFGGRGNAGDIAAGTIRTKRKAARQAGLLFGRLYFCDRTFYGCYPQASAGNLLLIPILMEQQGGTLRVSLPARDFAS